MLTFRKVSSSFCDVRLFPRVHHLEVSVLSWRRMWGMTSRSSPCAWAGCHSSLAGRVLKAPELFTSPRFKSRWIMASMEQDKKEKVYVIIRVRPLSREEATARSPWKLSSKCIASNKTCRPSVPSHSYTFGENSLLISTFCSISNSGRFETVGANWDAFESNCNWTPNRLKELRSPWTPFLKSEITWIYF